MQYVMEFSAPPATVFEWVRDPEKHKQWLQGVESTEFARGVDHERPGAKFVQRIKEGGRVNEYQGEVTAFEQDRHLAITLVGKAFTVNVDYRFEPIESNRTRMIFTCDFPRMSGFMKVMMFIMKPFMTMMFKKQMETLKKLVEARGSEPDQSPR